MLKKGHNRIIRQAALMLALPWGIAAILLLPTAAAVNGGVIKSGGEAWVIAGIILISVLSGAYFSAKERGRGVLTTGILCALLFLLTTATACACMKIKWEFKDWILWRGTFALAGGIGGSLLALRQNARGKKLKSAKLYKL